MNNEIIMQLIATLTAMQDTEENQNQQSSKEDKIEMLTIKQCADVVAGLSEHTIRQLVSQNKIKYIRTGQGKRGKILINKASLLAYCSDTV